MCSCSHHELVTGADQINRMLPPGAEGLFFGTRQIAEEGLFGERIVHAGPDTCLELVIPSYEISSLVAAGAYLVYPSWMKKWKDHVSLMGFNPDERSDFFSRNLTGVSIVDTGILPVDEQDIRSFEEFSGLPVRKVSVGTSLLEAIIHLAVTKWELRRERSVSQKRLLRIREELARQMASITFLSGIAQITNEDEVIGKILTVFETLYGPRSVRYIRFEAGIPGAEFMSPGQVCGDPAASPLLAYAGEEWGFIPDRSGFFLTLRYQAELIGILEVSGVQEQDRVREYLNLALSMSRFIGLAIMNARSWGELVRTREEIDRKNQQLNRMNEDLLTISDDLRFSLNELQKSQAELTEKEQFIREVINQLPIGICVLDRTLCHRYWNPMMEMFTGVMRMDALGKTPFELFPFLRETDAGDNYEKVLAGEAITIADSYVSFPRVKEPKWTTAIFTPWYDAGGAIAGIISGFIDISKRKKAEEEVIRVNRALKLAGEKIRILSSITRHDILNRITVISGYVDLFAPSVKGTDLEKACLAIGQASSDIQNLIEFTREYDELGVKEPIWQRIEPILYSRLITCLLDGVECISSVDWFEIYADQMLEKVIYNLIENSRRHGEHVTEIRITATPPEKEGEPLIIRYADNGSGVPDAEKELIFKKGHGKNTGLGLFLIREILALTEISIREVGIFGNGVEFEIAVPGSGWRYRVFEADSHGQG